MAECSYSNNTTNLITLPLQILFSFVTAFSRAGSQYGSKKATSSCMFTFYQLSNLNGKRVTLQRVPANILKLTLTGLVWVMGSFKPIIIARRCDTLSNPVQGEDPSFPKPCGLRQGNVWFPKRQTWICYHKKGSWIGKNNVRQNSFPCR